MSKGRFLLGNAEVMMSMAMKMRALASDLEATAAGYSPAVETLQEAPILDWWSFATRPDLCLEGVRTGHPVLGGDGEMTTTSGLYILDRDAGIARTLSRWYRLGIERTPSSLLS